MEYCYYISLRQAQKKRKKVKEQRHSKEGEREKGRERERGINITQKLQGETGRQAGKIYLKPRQKKEADTKTENREESSDLPC